MTGVRRNAGSFYMEETHEKENEELSESNPQDDEKTGEAQKKGI